MRPVNLNGPWEELPTALPHAPTGYVDEWVFEGDPWLEMVRVRV